MTLICVISWDYPRSSTCVLFSWNLNRSGYTTRLGSTFCTVPFVVLIFTRQEPQFHCLSCNRQTVSCQSSIMSSSVSASAITLSELCVKVDDSYFLLCFFLQPLMDNLESGTYEVFERDPVKYTQYQKVV